MRNPSLSLGNVIAKPKLGLNYFPTPVFLTEALLDKESFPQPVWEPACGSGHIVRVLKHRGFTVRDSDIQHYYKGHKLHDFLNKEPGWKYRSIITNPPYRMVGEFLARALSSKAERVAMHWYVARILRGTMLEVFRRTPPSTIYAFAHADPYFSTEDNAWKPGMRNHCWVVWDLPSKQRVTRFVLLGARWDKKQNHEVPS